MEEHYGSTTLHRKYIRGNDGKLHMSSRKKGGFVSITHFFMTVFLPQGYPDSVSEDYITYQVWDTVQAFASSITGTLAAQAVLKGYGVGDESATILAATLTWLLKDGTGMLGRILFAWMQGTSLDCDAKRWRLFADIINDIAIFLEIMGPHLPISFTLVVCVSGTLKSIVGVSGGATRAALTQHQARRNNMADVSAKDGSQETLVNLAGLICSFILVPIVTGRYLQQFPHKFTDKGVRKLTGIHFHPDKPNSGLIWTLYILFTTLHLYANYSAVKAVVMETFNQARLHILLSEYFISGNVQPPGVVNRQEPVLYRTKRDLDIQLGSSLHSLCQRSDDIDDLFNVYKSCRYILSVNIQTNCIDIVLSQSAGTTDQLQACYHAELINIIYQHKHNLQNLPQSIQSIANGSNLENLSTLRQVFCYAEKTFPHFLENVRNNGWKTDICLLGADEWRLDDQSKLSGMKTL